ncbi:sensor domain-containing diguanylate cyclase [Ruminiclostridium cellobioparum]|uniref:Diguanylate cyclase (GGDEF) domain-containing protein n=1 Tax=Ruminiclostridium cellobioparum subsp. termitidis CT1112 TaxID=1195236 RepID=S0FSZ9_RUMCE|nr:sensor domain-containing diguanylate cyclase [Ruminiclostridium cellobioparum]EMS73456.1 diguanylate cyclase (GGDEF) domain-containing protein [Ruminiclostridium cellobioparum subsp. termitidis CT1112]
MNKIHKFEKVLVNLGWVFIILLITGYVLRDIFDIGSIILIKQGLMLNISIIILFLFNVIKTTIINSSNLYSEKLFMIFRYTEAVILNIVTINFYEGIEAAILLIPLIFLTLHRGIKAGYTLLAFSAVIKIAYLITDFIWLKSSIPDYRLFAYDLFKITCLYFILAVMLRMSSAVYNSSIRNEMENARLVIELGEKYEQLEVAQDEIKNQYHRLMETNHKLEDTNRRLTSSIAEFYTLQQISEAIGSILDINDLLNFVNDVIIGVMGVNYSTIVLLDHRKNRLKVQFTNIRNKEDLAVLNDNINCKLLLDILENGKPVMENSVIPEKFDFIRTRKIGSFICLPFSSKSRKFGLTLIEHKNINTFDEDNLRLLTTIGKQVSMAIENAELYANLQDLATIDGLTGVHNRVYFHQKFEEEFNAARTLGYDLTLVILDIDKFKKFNDTYGHLFGDVVLKSVAQTVKNNLRSTDTIARFGGEEFVILLPRTSIEEGIEKVEDLRLKIENNIIKDNLIAVSVTASFGISCFPDISVNQVELIRDADNALYKAKECGRNCFKVAAPAYKGRN